MLGRSCALLLCIVALVLAGCVTNAMNMTCDVCYEFQVNNKGEEKCVRKAQCCGAKHSLQCLVSPCHDQMQKCPSARTCVPQYCEPECTAHYYDQDLNEMTTEQCNPQMDPVLKRCSHQPDEGNGDEVSERYYYNRVYRACHTFQYTGEGGNDNNFNTESGCLNVCGKIPGCPTPDLGIVPPGCRLSMETQSPDGCFYPQLACDRCASNPCPNCHTCLMDEDGESYCCKKQTLCVGAPKHAAPVEVHVLPPDEDTIRTCRLDKDPGEGGKWCKPEYDYFHYDRNYGSCQGFKWGCRGNDNIFTTKEECQTKCSGVPPCPMPSLIAPPTGCIWSFRAGLNGCGSPLLICKDTGGCQQDSCGKCSVCSNVYADDCKASTCKPIAYTCEADKWCEDYECKEASCDEGYKCVFTPKEGAKCVIDLPAMEVIRKCRWDDGEIKPCVAGSVYFNKRSARCENVSSEGCEHKRLFSSMEKCMESCRHVRPCPPTNDWYLMKIAVGCDLDAEFGINGCDYPKTVCPGAGCDKEPCQECERCKDEWPTDCQPQYAPIYIIPGTPTEAPCMPNGRTCTSDPVCEKWKCDDLKCQPDSKCIWKESNGKRTATCEKQVLSTTERCQLPLFGGNCGGEIVPAFAYNSQAGYCMEFTYDPSCGYGNANRFNTSEDCEKFCADVPPAPIPPDTVERCQMSIYGGNCGGEIVPAFGYNSLAGYCMQFTFDPGCGYGNANRFDTKVDCEQFCAGVSPAPIPQETVERCQMNIFGGNCGGEIVPAFGYNSQSGYCVEFTYDPGCGYGNANRFDTNEDCEQFCAGVSPAPIPQETVERCQLSLYGGNCGGEIVPAFGYNHLEGYCMEFTFDPGCGYGNANRFDTKEDCEQLCAHVPPADDGLSKLLFW